MRNGRHPATSLITYDRSQNANGLLHADYVPRRRMLNSIHLNFFRSSLLLLLIAGRSAWPQATEKHMPIIDMHLHAYKVADFGVGLGATPAVCSSNEGKTFYGW